MSISVLLLILSSSYSLALAAPSPVTLGGSTSGTSSTVVAPGSSAVFANSFTLRYGTTTNATSSVTQALIDLNGGGQNDGVVWATSTTPNTNQWQSVTYGNGVFVAVGVGEGGDHVMTSPDGITWTSRTSSSDSYWRSVTYGNGMFVAVAESGSTYVMTSPDGITWTNRTAPSLVWRSVTYGNGLFVAVGENGTGVMTSPDGITWTSRTGTGNLWLSVTYGNGMFVAVSYNGGANHVMTSTDGITWTARASASDISWNSVTYGNGLFVAVSGEINSNDVMTSPDGITWTLRSSPTTTGWASVVYGNGVFIASSISDNVMVSSDGINWTLRALPKGDQWLSITYGDGRFVSVSNGGDDTSVVVSFSGVNPSTLLSQNNGVVWATSTSAVDNDWSSVTYGNGLFVAVATTGTGNRVMTSPDGITWTSRTSALDNSWSSVVYGNGLFVAVATTGTGNRVMTSPDGITWTARTSAADSAWTSVSYGNGTFVAVASDGGSSGVMTSPDGITWTIRTSVDNQWKRITYGNGTFVAVSDSGAGSVVMTSPDGITWTGRTAAVPSNSWMSVAFGNGIFVAVSETGTNDRVMTSSDGVTWTSRTSAANYAWRAITYGNGLFVAAALWPGSNQNIMTSPDGITWTLQTSVSDNGWTSVAYANGMFVTVARGGTGDRVMISNSGTFYNKQGLYKAVSLVEITNNAGSVVYGSTTNPIRDTFSVPLTNLVVSSTTSEYKIRITPKSHESMSSATSSSEVYILKAKVSTISSLSGNVEGSDTVSSSVGIDNKAPDVIKVNGVTWATSTSAADNAWWEVAYGNGVFVAVSSTGSTDRVMTSSDGINWVLRTGTSGGWTSVTYGNGLFVAVAASGTGSNRVMTSPDGITWTLRTNPLNNNWTSVTYGNGLFVAVACGFNVTSACNNTAGDRVMTSPDGITWTARKSASDNRWWDVTYGNGLFVAISTDGTGNRVMTSPDGITWTSRVPAVDNDWYGITYGNGLFVAVGQTGTGNRVMTSPDGITWTSRTSAANNSWTGVTYGNGLFVAVAASGSGNRVMTSPDGVTWTSRTSAANNSWASVAYGNGVFVTVSQSGTGDRVMISSSTSLISAALSGENVVINYNTSDDTDLSSILILRKTLPITETPIDGTTYTVGASIGSATVACVDTSVTTSSSDSCTATDLTNETTYYFKIFAKDLYGNYSPYGVSSESVLTEFFKGVIVSLGSGQDLISYTIAPTTTPVFADSFTVRTNKGASGVRQVYLTLDGGSRNNGAVWATSTSAADNDWKSVTYSNGMFVAVSQYGTGNRVMTSPDGITWTGRSSPGGEWQSVTYGNGIFVAVAAYSGGGVMTSPDGITWTSRTPAAGDATHWRAVTFGNGLFVAVSGNGTNNRVMTSPDGITWTSRTSAANVTWTSVVYGNGLFVATACGNACGATATTTVMTSPDGITWTLRTAPNDYYWLSVTYGNGLFVAVSRFYCGGGDCVMTSPDGITWTSRRTPVNALWESVTYGNGLFTAVSSSNSTGRIMTSPDGITWTSREAPINNDWRAVGYGNGMFVAVSGTGTSTRVMTSSSHETPSKPALKSVGNTWATSTTGFDTSFNCITYGNGMFVAVSGTNDYYVMTSPDGVIWTKRTTPDNKALMSVTYGNGLFVAVSGWNSGNNLPLVSKDGITWTYETLTAAQKSLTWQGVTYGNGMFVAVSYTATTSGVMTSLDGTNWITRSTPNTNSWVSVTYGNGTFVAVSGNGTGNRVMSSSDGITWTARTSAGDKGWSSVTYGNGLFVAVAAYTGSDNIMTSPDGINWTLRTTSTGNNWFSVTYGNGAFVAVAGSGSSNRVMTSPDGITWTLKATPKDNSWQSVTYGNGRFVAVASNGVGDGVMVSLPDYTTTDQSAKLGKNDGVVWATSTSAYDGDWKSITYGNGVFVAVGYAGAVMTSYDGIIWTLRTSAADSGWKSVVYGEGLFVAVARTINSTSTRIMTSPDGITWTARTSDDNGWTSIAYGNGIFAVIGWNLGTQSVATSPDGITWTARDCASNPWNSITFGNNTFVAVAEYGGVTNVVTSPDGITWTLRTGAGNHVWKSVTYGNGLFVAVSTTDSGTISNRVMTSPDGITWTFRTASSNNDWMSVAYGNGLFIAVAESGTGDRIMTSSDGITWTSGFGINDNNWQAVTYGDGKFVALANTGVGNRAITSDSGTFYTRTNNYEAVSLVEITDNSGSTVYGSISNPASDTFIIPLTGLVASTSLSQYKVRITLKGHSTLPSPEGKEYLIKAKVKSLTSVSGSSEGSDTSGTVLTVDNKSPGNVLHDVGVWTSQTSAADYVWGNVTYGNGMFVALASWPGDNNGIMTSPDGINWTLGTLPENNSWNSLTYGNGKFVAVTYYDGGTNHVLSSSDGINWVVSNSAVDNQWTSVTYGNGLFVAVANSGTGNRVQTSPDGITWTARASAADNNWDGIAYGNGVFVAISTNGGLNHVMTSPDGITWTLRQSAADLSWQNIAYGNGIFVATVSYYGGLNNIMTSPDGITWTLRSSISNDYWGALTYGNGLFVVVAFDGIGDRVMTSPDGITWTSHSAAATNSWVSLAYGNGMFVAVSINGTGNRVMTSPLAPVVPSSNKAYLTFTTPEDEDISDIVVIKSSATSTVGVPVEGVTYATSSLIGSGSVVCAFRVLPSTTYTCEASDGLYNGNSYYFTLYTKDKNGNYSIGIIPKDSPTLIQRATVLGTGNDVASSTLAPGGAATTVDTFTLQADYGTDVMTSLNLTFATGTATSTSLVEITNETGTIVYGSLSNPDTDAPTITLNSTILTANTTKTQYRVRITPKSHVNMPDVPGSSYAVTAYVSSVIGTNTAQTGNDLPLTASTTIVTIDNRSPSSIDVAGIGWKRYGGVSGQWNSVTYGNGLFVAVTDSNVMTSPDGFTWTARTAAENNNWQSVAYGNNTFVAVSRNGTNRVMTSSDGITWTARSAASNAIYWATVAYGNGVFVALSHQVGAPDCVMTSPDGITWTLRTAFSGDWLSVAYGNGLFVATKYDAVITSSDGITWTNRTPAYPSSATYWNSVTYGNGLFVAVADFYSDKVMTSLDGITWTARTGVTRSNWYSVAYGNGLFVAVAGTSTLSNLMTSSDGITWSLPDNTQNNGFWNGVAYADNKFVAVGHSGDRVMTSSSPTATSTSGQIAVTFTNPPDTDFAGYMVLRSTSAITDTPGEGSTYATSSTLGASTVACASTSLASSTVTCTSTGLSNGTAYYFKIFTRDTSGNWSLGTDLPDNPQVPGATFVTLGTGNDPAGGSLAPGGSATTSDTFTFKTSSGTDVISNVTLTFATGTAQALSLVEITNDAGSTVYGSVSNPSTDTPTITLSNNTLTANTSQTQYRVRITPKSHVNMPTVPGAMYYVTSYVSNWTGGVAKVGRDQAGGMVMVDNLSPSNASSVTATSTSGQVSVTFTTPTDNDFNSYIVAYNTEPIDTPVEGVSYATSSMISGTTIACSSTSGKGVLVTCTKNSLSNGLNYYFKVFTRDTVYNWNSGTELEIRPNTYVTTLGKGLDTASTTLTPGGSATTSDTFTFKTSSGSDMLENITLTFATGTAQALSLVEITNDAGNIVYGSKANPSTDTHTIALSNNTLTANTTETQYRVRITPKSHVNMPSVPGTMYYVTSYVSDWSANGSKSGNDTLSGTTTVITIDNSSPAAPSLLSASINSQEHIRIAYTNPSTADAKDVVVLRSTSPIVVVPVEGVAYNSGDTIGASTVTCVKNNITLGVRDYCSYTAPQRQTSYYFKVFSKDTTGNYSVGASPSAFILIPSPNGGAFQLEAESWNGGTSTTTGGTSSGGDGGSGTGTTTNATTTTSTSTPGGGGGEGDVGFFYQGTNLALENNEGFFSRLFSFFMTTQTKGVTSNAYAKEPAEQKTAPSSSCSLHIYNLCIARSIPWLEYFIK